MSDTEKVSSSGNGQQEFDFDPRMRCVPGIARSATNAIRLDGNEQYVEVKGGLQPLHRRPLWSNRYSRRAPLTDAG